MKSYAKHVVKTTLTNEHVTIAQVKAAKRILQEMGKRKTVKGFNNQLLKLLQVAPRKERYIQKLLATAESDFADIIYREENLIAAMEIQQLISKKTLLPQIILKFIMQQKSRRKK